MTDELKKILNRLNAIEGRLDELDDRTVGQIRIGPAKRDDAKLAAERHETIEKIIAEIKPVDRSKVCLTDGAPVTPDHKELKDNGQQKGYVVLTEDERAKGFVRPVRSGYIHSKCGSSTTMGRALAETFARDPYFYSGTFCCGCGKHFPVGEDGEFVWAGTDEKVGT